MACAETQDLGIREVPDAEAFLIEMTMQLQEVTAKIETLEEKVRGHSRERGSWRFSIGPPCVTETLLLEDS